MVNDLDKKIRISLTVREGKNFTSSPGTYFLEATLNGHKTTSEPIFTEHSWPLFNTEFTWRVDRREFNYLKDNNRPLRIECFTVDGWRRRRLGFVLLQLSSAITNSYDTSGMDNFQGNLIDIPGAGEDLLAGDFRWVKLFGLDSGLRLLHPELAVKLTVTGPQMIQEHILESIWEKAPKIPTSSPPRRIFTCSSLCDRAVTEIELKPKQKSTNQLRTARSIITALQCFRRTESILCLEGIDSGDARGRVSAQADNYTIGFLIQCAYNLELLTSQDNSYVNGQNQIKVSGTHPNAKNDNRPQTAYEPYNLTLTFLELTVNTKYFPKACHQVVLNDKIVFKVRSSNECLMSFLSRYSKAKLRLWRGRKLLGYADMDLGDFNVSKFFSESAMLRGRYERDVELLHPDTGRIPRSKGGKTPFVTVTTFLRREPYIACESTVNYLSLRSTNSFPKPTALRKTPHNYCSSVRTKVESTSRTKHRVKRRRA